MAPLQREIILRMKHETPETEKIPGIEYYPKSVIRHAGAVCLDVARYAFG